MDVFWGVFLMVFLAVFLVAFPDIIPFRYSNFSVVFILAQDYI
jgi:hypothetical protein